MVTLSVRQLPRALGFWGSKVGRLTTTTRRLYLACPSSFHEFEGPEPIPYDVEGLGVRFIPCGDQSIHPSTFFFIGTDRGNKYKVTLGHS